MPNFVQCLQQQLRPAIFVEAIKLYRRALNDVRGDTVSLVDAMSASGTEDESSIPAGNVFDEGNIRVHIRRLLDIQFAELGIQEQDSFRSLLKTLINIIPTVDEINALVIPQDVIEPLTELQMVIDPEFTWDEDRYSLLESILTSVWTYCNGILRDKLGEQDKKHDVQQKQNQRLAKEAQLNLQVLKLTTICEEYEEYLLEEKIKPLLDKAKKNAPEVKHELDPNVINIDLDHPEHEDLIPGYINYLKGNPEAELVCDKYVHTVQLRKTLLPVKPVNKQLIDFQNALPAASAVIAKSRDTKGILVLKALAAILLIVCTAGLATCAVGLLFNVRGAEESRRMEKRLQKYQHLFRV